MATENPTWGAPRIHGELLKLGFAVSERTVSRDVERIRPEPRRTASQTWSTFLGNQAKGIVAVDSFTLSTIRFEILYVFVILALERRRLVFANVTTNPTALWLGQQVVNAFPCDTAPKFLIRDRDGAYGEEFSRRVRSLGIRSVKTTVRALPRRRRRHFFASVFEVIDAGPHRSSPSSALPDLRQGCGFGEAQRPLISPIHAVLAPFFPEDALSRIRVVPVARIENPPFHSTLVAQGLSGTPFGRAAYDPRFRRGIRVGPQSNLPRTPCRSSDTVRRSGEAQVTAARAKDASRPPGLSDGTSMASDSGSIATSRLASTMTTEVRWRESRRMTWPTCPVGPAEHGSLLTHDDDTILVRHKDTRNSIRPSEPVG
jgi:hypothetical protein